MQTKKYAQKLTSLIRIRIKVTPQNRSNEVPYLGDIIKLNQEFYLFAMGNFNLERKHYLETLFVELNRII